MDLDLLHGEFAVVRFEAGSPLPAWAERRAVEELYSLTQTGAERSLVCEANRVPPDAKAERGWRCLRIAGPLDFSLVGVLAAIADPLARAAVPIFVISTFDTDYVLVKSDLID